ncbi:MAG TPA: FtsX-like permease family protein [Gammaproteobacteria bacterium]|nr:FtsX-like permease family protein [Gammaproteobacteria bacterium]
MTGRSSTSFSFAAIRLSLRMLGRDWRAGELRVLFAAIVLAVSCVSSVGFFTDRIAQALMQQTGELLGADLRVVADHPLPVEYDQKAERLGLHVAQTRSFRSMIQAADTARLAEIKAVSASYPLRGVLRIAPQPFARERLTQALPAVGEVWVDPQLLQALDAKVGDYLQVGFSRLRISAVLTYEPDRSGNMFSIAPRLLMTLADLPASGLIQEGSHVRYHLLVAGEAKKLARLRRDLTPLLQRGERVEGASDARPEVRVALQRAQQFLGLASVVAVLLACVAIALAARRYARRHLDTCALLRCFGASQRRISQLFFIQSLALSLLAGLLGIAGGFLAQQGLVVLLGDLIVRQLPWPSWTPAGVGLLVALGGMLGFALPPLLQLRDVPALRVLRRVPMQAIPGRGLQAAALLAYFCGAAMIVGLVVHQAGELVLGGILLAGVLMALMLLWGVAAGFTFGLHNLLRVVSRRSLRGRVSVWHLGLVNLTRNRRATTLQVMAFGVGLMVLLLLGIVRGDLLQTWAQRLPADAPNRFVTNIQPAQLLSVQDFFTRQGMTGVSLFPMVRGRLTAINGTAVSPQQFDNPRAQGLVRREFNLSWADRLQADNRIVQGRWWGKDAGAIHELSVEEGLAKTLGIALGDRLTFRIAGETFSATVSSLRSVQWDSFRANFFVLAPPGALDGYPVSYITSFFLPQGKAELLNRLLKAFPNLTVIDIDAIMQQVRQIIARVSLAVEFVFLFTLAAGLLVMAAAIQSTLDVRHHENAVLRALGARRRRLRQSLMVEFVSLGALAGVVAALFANGLGEMVARQVLEMEYVFNPWLWLVGLLAGGLGVGLAGLLGTRQVLNSPPLAVLRRL